MTTKYQHDIAMHYLHHHTDELGEEERRSLERIANTYVGPSRYADFADYERLKEVDAALRPTCPHKG